MRLSLLAIFIFLATGSEAYYDFNPRLKQAFTKIIQLRVDEGRKLLEKERQYNPGNHLTVLYENYIDFLLAFISEEEASFIEFKTKSAQRIKLLENEEKEGGSPYHLYALAEITLQDAMLKVKFKEYLSGATEIRKAYKMIQRNQIIFPSFLLNKKLDGFVHTLVGAVPQEYRWLIDLVGMEGTVPGGTEELRSLYFLLDNTELACYKEELLFYLSNIHNTFAQDESEAEELLDLLEPFTDANPLLRYCYTNIAMKWGRNDEAIEMFEPVLTDVGTIPFYYLNYKKGLSKLRKLDTNAAEDFRFFLRNFGGMNHKKSVYQKLAWVELLKGNIAKYKSYMAECLKTGNMNVDEDKDAYHEAKSGELPNIILLRARLLFDGGYYKQSWSEISGKPLDSFPRFRDQLEVTYRLGRIMEKLSITEKAIYYYSKTLKNGASSEFYFAANSALLLGNIYEEEGQYDLALSYYDKCLQMRKHEYQNSIDQKAQAGQDRIKAQLKQQRENKINNR